MIAALGCLGCRRGQNSLFLFLHSSFYFSFLFEAKKGLEKDMKACERAHQDLMEKAEKEGGLDAFLGKHRDHLAKLEKQLAETANGVH